MCCTIEYPNSYERGTLIKCGPNGSIELGSHMPLYSSRAKEMKIIISVLIPMM